MSSNDQMQNNLWSFICSVRFRHMKMSFNINSVVLSLNILQNLRTKITSPQSDIMRQMFDYIDTLPYIVPKKKKLQQVAIPVLWQTKAIKMCNKWIQYNIRCMRVCVCERSKYLYAFFVVYSLWLRKRGSRSVYQASTTTTRTNSSSSNKKMLNARCMAISKSFFASSSSYVGNSAAKLC